MDKRISLDSSVRSEESNVSDVSKNSKNSAITGDSKTESCRESKHSKVVLIHQNSGTCKNDQISKQEIGREKGKFDGTIGGKEKRNNSNSDVRMLITSCGQLLFGLILMVFGVLVLVHGVSLGSSGAGLWAGAGALVAGALGLVATLTATSTKQCPRTNGFSTAHLASSLVALALSNMSTITALTAVIRDIRLRSENGQFLEIETDWGTNIGLLLSSLVELFLAGYTCVTLTPKLCGCLNDEKLESQMDQELQIDAAAAGEFDSDTGRVKTRNMVHQWVIAQTHPPKTPPPQSAPFYVLHQPMVPLHPMIQAPYGNPHGKYPAHYIPTYGPVSIIPHMMPSPARPPMQMYRSRRKPQHPAPEHEQSIDRPNRSLKKQPMEQPNSAEKEETIRDLAQTYTGLDKRISEEFISICMDPERKSKASSHHGSEIGASNVPKKL